MKLETLGAFIIASGLVQKPGRTGAIPHEAKSFARQICKECGEEPDGQYQWRPPEEATDNTSDGGVPFGDFVPKSTHARTLETLEDMLDRTSTKEDEQPEIPVAPPIPASLEELEADYQEEKLKDEPEDVFGETDGGVPSVGGVTLNEESGGESGS